LLVDEVVLLDRVVRGYHALQGDVVEARAGGLDTEGHTGAGVDDHVAQTHVARSLSDDGHAARAFDGQVAQRGRIRFRAGLEEEVRPRGDLENRALARREIEAGGNGERLGDRASVDDQDPAVRGLDVR
jgi:hypothetical protein